MLKKKLIFIGGTAVLFLMCILVTLHSPRYQAAKLLDMDLPDLPRPVDAQVMDNHGVWFGDGELYGKLTFDQSNGEALEERLAEHDGWEKLPLPENVTLLLYGGEKDGIHYGSPLADGWGSPTVTEGYYYFLDRLHDRKDDALLLNDSAINVTIAIYDSQQAVLYFMTYDT